MRLIQSRVKCVKGVTDSGWFIPSRESTLVYGPEGLTITDLFKALQSLNPLYDIARVLPLADHPKEWQQGQYKKRVIPEKKTAVIMVFSAPPELVRELSAIDPALIETDRVEAGRRLDNSRWITFVEISTSTRWSEIAESMHYLHNRLPEHPDNAVRYQLEKLWSRLKDLLPTDRLNTENAEFCCSWLDAAITLMPAKDAEVAKACQFKAKRAERFINAKEHMQEWLPTMVKISRDLQLQPRYSLSSLMENHHTTDPVTLLLKQIFHEGITTVSHKGESFERKMAESRENIAAYIGQIDLPILHLTDRGIEFEQSSKTGRAQQQMATILTICLLTDLCRRRQPLLLLDQLIDDLDNDEQRLMVRWLQELGTKNQLIISTTESKVAKMQGWQKVIELEQTDSTISSMTDLC